MFAHCLASPARPKVPFLVTGEALELDCDDVTLKNLEGHGALEAAERWAESRRILWVLEGLKEYLPARERALVDRVLKKDAGVPAQKRYADNEHDSDSDAEDERGRTAHKLFAEGSVTSQESGQSTPINIRDVMPAPDVVPARTPPQSPQRLARAGPLTPESSPMRRRVDKGKKRQLDDPDFIPEELKPSLLPSADITFAVEKSRPFSDLENVLRNRPTPVASPQSSPSAARKRRRLGPSSPRSATENQDGTTSGISFIKNSLPSVDPMPSLSTSENHPATPPESRHSSSLARRFRIADKLCRARPDLASPAYLAKRKSWSTRSELQRQYREGLRSISNSTAVESSAADTVIRAARPPLPLEDTEEAVELDWHRSRMVAETIRGQIKRGEQVVLPALECLNSQVADE